MSNVDDEPEPEGAVQLAGGKSGNGFPDHFCHGRSRENQDRGSVPNFHSLPGSRPLLGVISSLNANASDGSPYFQSAENQTDRSLNAKLPPFILP